jgi:hypothetical protein
VNKQPFYHRATILFTATRPITEEEFRKLVAYAVECGLEGAGLEDTVEIEEWLEPEAGDPMDLMG